MPILTGIDILGIQGYVFASNRLRDVLSASRAVEFITSRHFLEGQGLDPERILLAAGGNAAVTFDDIEAARAWTTRYTRNLHDEAPGIDVVIAHRSYEGKSLAWALKALRQIDLPRMKLERWPDVAQLGIGVTASCTVTGRPAIDEENGDLLGRQVGSLRSQERIQKAKERWEPFLCPETSDASDMRFAFPDELDRMGRTHGDTSLLGIVHVDGNGVGKKIQNWLDDCIAEDHEDAEIRRQCRAWSDGINALGEGILWALVKRVRASVGRDEEGVFLRGTPHELGFLLDGRGDATHLPLRPILLGGDDLTFVCDGRIALDLAATALSVFAKHPIPYLGKNGEATVLSGCAGVALVKAHAPFHRGYELAEALCRSAKQRRRIENEQRGIETGSWLDWHVGTTRPGESVKEIRQRQYGQDKCTMRPYPLDESDRRESWGRLDEDMLGPGKSPAKRESGFRGMRFWAESRNRVKLLRSLVFEGREAVKKQIDTWKTMTPEIRMPTGIPNDGFIGASTPLLDAIELTDIHLRLERDPVHAL